MNEFIEAGTQARIGVEEFLHQVRVAGDDHDELVPVVLHGLQDRVDSLLAEIALSLIGGKRVGFVDEQDPAHRAVDHFLRFDRSLADVAGHQSGTVHLHQLPLLQQAKRMVHLRQDTSHRGFSGAGVARKHQVLGDIRLLQPHLLALQVHLLNVDQRGNLLLHRREADQIVQLLENLIDLLLGILRGQIQLRLLLRLRLRRFLVLQILSVP